MNTSKTKSIPVLFLWITLWCGQILYAQSQSTTATRGSIFTDSTATDSDYLVAIEKAGELMQSAYNNAEFKADARHLFAEIKRTQSKLDMIFSSLKGGNPNVRNQQMYRVVLQEILQQLEDQNTQINAHNDELDKIKAKLLELRNDKNLTALLKDTLRRKQFKVEFQNLKTHYVSVDSLMKLNQSSLNTQKRLTVQRKIEVTNALANVENDLEKSGSSIMKKEYPFLWSVSDTLGKSQMKHSVIDKLVIEKNVAGYYLSYKAGGLIMLAFLMTLLGWYLFRNINYLKKNNHIRHLEALDFKYLNKGIVLPVLVIGLNIAVVSNLYAPALFIDVLQIILLAILTQLFKSKWSTNALRKWRVILILLFVLCFTDLFIEVGFLQRVIFIALNILGIYFGRVHLKNIQEELYIQVYFKWATKLFIALNVLAILCNLFGRVTVANTLSLTTFFSFTQIIALSVLLKIILEIILLQIYSSRIKRNIEKLFDHQNLSETLKKPFILIIGYMWVVVIAANINIWEALRSAFVRLLNHPISIGSITFTTGNIVWFFIIVWVAHLLQKYVAYFFGEIDDENEENVNKRQHSKLLITRLVVLVVGYLLAVAASGMPLDKLSILLGALGVGVGLGLQNIVSNFVSGIILIFDKPIQIGDVVQVSSESGRVKSMGLRTTKINGPNGAEIIIPNGNLLSQNITNWTYTDNFKLMELDVEVAGEVQPEEINAIVEQALKTVNLINEDRAPQIYYTAITDGKYKIQIKFWCSIYRTEETISTARQVLFSHFKAKGLTFSA
jgi:potassium efflux system protein